jgi:arginine/lysine/ornithine decarboxylase
LPEDPIGPIQKMVEHYARQDVLRFHMPGHKGLLAMPDVTLDVTEVPGTDSLFNPEDGILMAENQAAQCWQAARSFLLVNGSTAGIQAMILWAGTQGRTLLLPRDCHISAVYACAAAGIQPLWIEPYWNPREQITQFFDDPELLLPEGNAAIFHTYPDYYGRCINLGTIKEKLNGRGTALLIDSAHGAHFAFSDRLPRDAGVFADMWVAGAHKTLPAPTQTAFLHVKDDATAAEAARLLRGVTTTSPSYLLMAGLDNSRVFMQRNRNMLDELVDNCLELANRLNGIDGLHCWSERDVVAMGYGQYDPTRLVVDVRGLGMTGWEAGARLRELGVQAEMCDICRVVLIASVMDNQERLLGLYNAFVQLAALKKKTTINHQLQSLPLRGDTVMTIRQAWLSKTMMVELRQSTGRIAAEPFGAYPPGIPLCMPGETITKDVIEVAQEARALGGGFFGVREGKVMIAAD